MPRSRGAFFVSSGSDNQPSLQLTGGPAMGERMAGGWSYLQHESSRPPDCRDISRPPFAVQTHADSGPRVARRRSPHLADGALDATRKRASWARFCGPAARELAEVEGSKARSATCPRCFIGFDEC